MNRYQKPFYNGITKKVPPKAPVHDSKGVVLIYADEVQDWSVDGEKALYEAMLKRNSTKEVKIK